MNSPEQSTPPASKRELGMAAIFAVLVGGGCLLMTLVGLINTALDGHWVLRVSGAEVDVPDNYEVCAGLGAVGVLLIGLALFGSFVRGHFEQARGKPALRAGIIVAALGLLLIVGRGLQVMALINTYGSMLAYYATDGDLEDVAAELAKGPTAEALDAAVGRAAQYDNHEALALLLDAGADLRDATSPEDRRYCILGGVGLQFIDVALAHGVGPDSCPNSEALIWQVINGDRSDGETALIVERLAAQGWSTATTPDHSDEAPAALAARLGKEQTLTALAAAQR